jgi:hypothetical protein
MDPPAIEVVVGALGTVALAGPEFRAQVLACNVLGDLCALCAAADTTTPPAVLLVTVAALWSVAGDDVDARQMLHALGLLDTVLRLLVSRAADLVLVEQLVGLLGNLTWQSPAQLAAVAPFSSAGWNILLDFCRTRGPSVGSDAEDDNEAARPMVVYRTLQALRHASTYASERSGLLALGYVQVLVDICAREVPGDISAEAVVCLWTLCKLQPAVNDALVQANGIEVKVFDLGSLFFKKNCCFVLLLFYVDFTERMRPNVQRRLFGQVCLLVFELSLWCFFIQIFQ